MLLLIRLLKFSVIQWKDFLIFMRRILFTGKLKLLCLLLLTSITTPQDAHERLMLQVHLGSEALEKALLVDFRKATPEIRIRFLLT